MSEQTESYIVLKPIAERFSRVASEITDDEIKQIIKSEMREQLGRIRFGDVLSELVDEWFEDEDHVNMIRDTFTESVKNRIKF